MPLADGEDVAGVAYAAPCDRVGLGGAFAAWESGDAALLISECAKAAGASDVVVVDHPEGPIVRALVHRVALFAQARPDGSLFIETPVVRLPLTHYVPALRLLLELSDRDAIPIRFSVRGELVVGRFSGRIMGVPPPTLTTIFERLRAAAIDASRQLVGLLHARAIAHEEHAVMSPDSLRVKLAPPSAPLTKPPPVHKLDSIPPVVKAAAPSKPTAPPPAATPTAPPPPDLFADDLPPVLGGRAPAPASAAADRSGLAKSLKIETQRSADTTQIPSQAKRPMSPLRIPDAPAPSNDPPARTLVSEVGNAPAPKKTGAASFGVPSLVDEEATIDPLGDTFIGAKSVGSRPAGPGQGLSELLGRAQNLGVALSFADQPATMCLLIRATLYQAILEYDASVPGAVAHLAEQTVEQTREIYITAPGKRRGVMAIPEASPAFEAMASIVEQRCEMPVGVPLAVTPITTSQDAKQHIARYVSEIDQAPKDVDLRQFLAIGAVSELLVRTKLPPATQERLRGIIAHAKKEGPKQAVADVIMTALTRMMA